ncbi:MAG: glycosyltransferase family 4 protein [Candidatus Kapabacteria bacterium]|nr:glycosyltransferase family 4 protein [Candidatus Kapabacteria bacterium]MDW8011796.1 glycosyltransferase family 4 protein [Bacteroidota bacterium]
MPRLCIAGHRHWSEHAGGVELQTRFLGEALQHYGWEVVYLCHSLQGKQGWEDVAGTPVYWLPLYPYGWAVPQKEVERVLEEVQPEVLYQRGWGTLQESGSVLSFALRRKIPYVFAISSDALLRWRFPTTRAFTLYRYPRWRSWLLLPYALWSDARLHRLLRKAPYILVQHEQQALWLRQRYARIGLLVRTLHPEPLRSPEKHPTPLVAWIHNYRPHAQLSSALRIATALAERAEFHFVTGATRREQLHELRRWRSLPKTLLFYGALPVEDVERLLERAWVLLHTGLYEGFPNTFVQAWLRETPVYSLWVDPAEVITRHGLGFCARGDLTLLQRELEDALNHPEDLRALGKRARQYAESRHGLRHNSYQLHRLFEGIRIGLSTEELRCLWANGYRE